MTRLHVGFLLKPATLVYFTTLHLFVFYLCPTFAFVLISGIFVLVFALLIFIVQIPYAFIEILSVSVLSLIFIIAQLITVVATNFVAAILFSSLLLLPVSLLFCHLSKAAFL